DLVCHMLRPHRRVRLTLDYKSRETRDSLEFELVGQNVRYLCGTVGGAACVGQDGSYERLKFFALIQAANRLLHLGQYFARGKIPNRFEGFDLIEREKSPTRVGTFTTLSHVFLVDRTEGSQLRDS